GSVGVDYDVAYMIADAPGAAEYFPVQDQSPAHARSKSQAKDDPFPFSSSDPGFSQGGQVCVILEKNLFLQFLFQNGYQGHIFPIQIRGVDDDPLFGVEGAGGAYSY